LHFEQMIVLEIRNLLIIRSCFAKTDNIIKNIAFGEIFKTAV
jgi:hypothetical protein